LSYDFRPRFYPMIATPSLSRAIANSAAPLSTVSSTTRSERRQHPGKPDTRRSPQLSKRDQLLETAWQLFYRDGYHATGIDRILTKAGVAKMTLYKHFRSKEELILAVLEKRSAQFRESFSEFLDAKKRTPERDLLAVFDWLGTWVASKDFRGCLFQKAMAEYQELEDPIHQAALAHKTAFHGEIRRLVVAAGLAKPKALTDQLALLVEGAILNAHALGASTPAVHAREAAQTLVQAAQRIR
jgi:AcrR family transcriptional regulator